jgi:hypothetical protein
VQLILMPRTRSNVSFTFDPTKRIGVELTPPHESKRLVSRQPKTTKTFTTRRGEQLPNHIPTPNKLGRNGDGLSSNGGDDVNGSPLFSVNPLPSSNARRMAASQRASSKPASKQISEQWNFSFT